MISPPKPLNVSPLPNPGRLSKRKRVTVAAGYVCDEGVILCADTQETIPGFTKTDVQKLLSFDVPPLRLVFAGSGNNATQIDDVIYEIALKFQSTSPSDPVASRAALRDSVNQSFPRQFYPRERPEVDILLAIQSVDAADLYRITDCNIAPVQTHVCVGSGVILGSQLFDRHYRKEYPLYEAAIVSIYVLYHVKKWVDGCGGQTDIALIPKTGGKVSFMPTNDVGKLEIYCKAYDDAVKGLLVEIPRTPKDLNLFNAYIENARKQLGVARGIFQEWEDTMREVSAQLGMPYEQYIRTTKNGAQKLLEIMGLTPSVPQKSEDPQ
jgi:20S proteasome alpha/beta subunit